jgi:hypothetical protein
MALLPENIRAALIDNARRQEPVKGTDDEIDFIPVVRLFTPDGSATWLLTELDPEDQDTAFGLADLGFGCPEIGTVSLAELKSVRGPLGLAIEIDLHFRHGGAGVVGLWHVVALIVPRAK